jgi:hypothetical protein
MFLIRQKQPLHMVLHRFQGIVMNQAKSILLMSSSQIDFALPNIQDPKGLSEVILKASKMNQKKELEGQRVR